MPEEAAANGGTPEATGGTPETMGFESWIATQDAAVKAMLDARDAPLRNALQQERDNAKALHKEIKALSQKAEAGSEIAKTVTELSGKLETEQKRADFYEAATAAGCRNLRLAWLVASADGLALTEIQKNYPELFASKPATHAGNGANSGPSGEKQDMNTLIRKKAGW